MSPERFDHLLSMACLYIKRKSCHSCDAIAVGGRLAVCLPYLSTGDSQNSQSFAFRIGHATKWRIYHCPIRASYETVESIIKATICLHNYLCLTENAHYLPVVLSIVKVKQVKLFLETGRRLSKMMMSRITTSTI